ncbi:tRNA (guanosine(37)-N1)-methyltransferase TrmD [Candidatus Gracilibacteria bacterium HOT-871]|nr:tRNA (guanosine(37)-N1)-methyltransferase TrmD [Candidatus Gracilibacteria bacterium HOT-871]MBB1564592.1 tRNA (guanosine(37)-N1)-methyltransferase TrmD [Candidatus Gracilibacteria bacterium]RKW21578.1 MAG: tRNA (guanosine(37)-N1)-methyltransferase TrmD [Candidatus Gracilibacteria bacterium]
MNFHIITIFPESFKSYFSSSIMDKAMKNNLFSIELYKLNDFSKLSSKRVDDKAYGMHGQVISAEVLSDAIEFIFKKVGKKIPVIYMTPSGELLNQEKVEYFYENLKNDCIIICGHYEGIDERIVELYVDFEISIGEYVLSSGELAASVFIDSFVRNISGVLGNKLSLEEDSFSKKFERKKEYPVYTRPKIFKNLEVPEILLSGNHAEIENWKKNNLHK